MALLMTRVPEHSPHSRNDDGGLTRWERGAGHAGYIAEGVFYLPVGFFALVAAMGHQQPDGSEGALAKLGGRCSAMPCSRFSRSAWPRSYCGNWSWHSRIRSIAQSGAVPDAAWCGWGIS